MDQDNLENKCDEFLRNVANPVPIKAASNFRRWKFSITLLLKRRNLKDIACYYYQIFQYSNHKSLFYDSIMK
jgi:hypothetical protein